MKGAGLWTGRRRTGLETLLPGVEVHGREHGRRGARQVDVQRL